MIDHMTETQTEQTRRLLYILHRGFVELRMLALNAKHQQAHDLADALEPVPGFLDDWRDEYLDLIRFNLRTYQTNYAGESFDYLAELDQNVPPEKF